MGRLAPPGYPNMNSTPSRSRASRTMSAPVISLAPCSLKNGAPAFVGRGLASRRGSVLLGRARPRPKQAYEPQKGKKAEQKEKGARHRSAKSIGDDTRRLVDRQQRSDLTVAQEEMPPPRSAGRWRGAAATEGCALGRTNPSPSASPKDLPSKWGGGDPPR